MPRLLPWQWLRRQRARPPTVEAPPAVAAPAPSPAAPALEPRDEHLRFAREYLLASGARVRLEGDEVVAGTLPDGGMLRYTTVLARARGDEGIALLAAGSPALAALLDACAERARLMALDLPPAGDAAALALGALATPDTGCVRCLGAGRAAPHSPGVPSCAGCPLRERQLVFSGLEGEREAVVVRRWEAREVELTYLIAARDRHGRRYAWERLAVGADGRRRAPLAGAALERASAGTLAPADGARLDATLAAARNLLAPTLAATASFLRQRTESEYAQRLVETRATHRRARSEEPARADELDAALARELEALADLYAVEVDARLEGICTLATPVAEVRVRAAAGMLTLAVDLGRGEVLPPACVRCGAECQAGRVCGRGHVTCAQCAWPDAGTGVPTCVACDEAGPAGSTRGTRQTSIQTRAVRQRDGSPPADDALTVAGLEALSPGIWSECAAWLLEAMGYTLSGPPTGERMLRWAGRRGDAAVAACALRLPVGWLLDEEDVRLVANPSPGGGEEVVLLTTADATEAAAREAERLGVRLVTRREIAVLLARLAGAHDRERAEAREETRARARAAAQARKSLLAALKAHEAALARPGRATVAAARSDIAAAASEIGGMRREAERALLAWDTLVADWEASFGDRPQRDGSLRLAAEAGDYVELAERARHLREAMAQVAARLQRAPAAGDLGYTECRQAVVEELTRRCEALRLRVQAVDPARWQDFTQARDLEAEAAATRARTAAERAAARADQLYAQLTPRPRLPR